MRIAVLATALSSAVVSLVLADPATAAMRTPTSIAPQDLSNALRVLAADRRLQILYTTQTVANRQTSGAVGEFTVDEALTRLLGGTGLAFQYVDENTITILSRDEGASSPLPTKGKGPEGEGSVSAGELRKSFWSRFRLAQSDTPSTSQVHAQNPSPSRGEGQGEDGRPAQSQKTVELEEVVVTGSHIRGSEAAGSKLIVIGREQIERSGFGRVQDVLATLTQNFNGVNEATYSLNGAFNLNRGAEVQLRGLGAGTTLTLVNGHRQALGGTRGTVVDVASISASAVDRIEILPEGASALYGSDAIGGVVNVILRKDFSGLETRARASSADGDADGQQFAQLWGTSWSRGHVLLAYQYDRRDPLRAAERPYTAANYDYRPFGGSDFRTVGGNPGTILDPTTFRPVAAIPSGQDGSDLTAAQLIQGGANYTDFVTSSYVLPKEEMHSALLSASYDITEDWELFADARYATRDFEQISASSTRTLTIPTTNPFNRMGRPVVVAYDFTEDLGPQTYSGTTETLFTTLGVKGHLPHRWQIEFSGVYAKERNPYHEGNIFLSSAVSQFVNSTNPATALNVFGDGSHTNPTTLAALTVQRGELGIWTTETANVTADGPLFDTPAGTVRLAVGGDYRREHLSQLSTYPPILPLSRNVSRNVSAVFAELAVPIMASNSPSGRLDLTLAGRYESYNDFGSTLDPKIGLSWQPLNSVKLRGTWGTSFRAPPFYLANPQFNAASSLTRTVTDPAASSGQSQVLVVSGADPNIEEETADVWTVGLDFTPPAIKELSLSLTYFNINYKDRIQNAGSYTTYLSQESVYAPVIIRDPTQAQINAVCVPGTACTGPYAAILDGRIRNLSRLRTRGMDMGALYSIPTQSGKWGIGLRGTYTFDFKTQLTDTAPTFDLVDTSNNPLSMRVSGDLSWTMGGWSARITANYADSYQDVITAAARRIDSLTTYDLYWGYQVLADHTWLDKTRLSLSAINVSNERPPYVNNGFGYDPANASLLGRQISLQVVKEW